MLKKILSVIFFLVLFLSAVTISPDAKEIKEQSPLERFFKSVNMGLYVDATYQFVFDKEDRADIDDGSRPLYPDNNSFSLNAFTVSIEKKPTMETDGRVMDLFGFRGDVLIGQQADLIASSGLGEENDNIDIYQGYLHILIPVGDSGINLYAGKFVTLAGFEVIEARNNPNISRSFLFGNAIPFTHTGVRISTTFSGFDLTLGINNGWDVTDDNNEAKTVETQVAYSYSGDFITNSWVGVTGYFGREDDADEGFRSLITIVGTLTLREKITLTADLDFGWESEVSEIGGNDAFWWGVAGYVVWNIGPTLSLALRGEYFDDQDGSRMGQKVTLTELTPTIIVRPFRGKKANDAYFDNVEIRLEYRWDHSDEPFFVKEGENLEKNQHGVMIQFLYWIDI